MTHGGKTHRFKAAGADGRYYVNTTITDGLTDNVSFRFIINDDGSYTVISDSHNLAAPYSRGGMQGIETVRMNDADPPVLSDDHSRCFGWYQWSVDVDRCNYLGEVKVSWDGERFMHTYCLFPYNLSTVEVIYEGRHGHDVATGSGHFDEGSPTYDVSAVYLYTSAT